MIVVADSSPLVALTNIGHIDVLPNSSGRLLSRRRFRRNCANPADRRPFVTSSRRPPIGLLSARPVVIQPIPSLHAGELAAISLAQELKADLLLIDEVRGRQAAGQLRIPVTGTIGVLELAADHGLINLQDAFGRLKTTDFWISHPLLDEGLKLHFARKRKV